MSKPLDRETVLKVARLGRLKLAESEIDDYAAKLGQILQYVEQLNEVDTTDVEPMANAVARQNVFRDDVVTPSLPRGAALQNAPQTDGQSFLVPQIIDTAG
jgi:aspartyl-tRNA(Asn)/glutamyl-tRNA(Gln) amidotransferase subunit C